MLEIDYIPKDRYKLIKKLIKKPEFNIDFIGNISKSASLIANWILVAINYLDFIFGL